eukprot:TRINITY_DN36366_c0_g1_i4.p2 TRINITY_DN36366_c0_g1~~TRINITY_DN36366_c0_g1_i4.p2  ORF type:complete len:167 (-),score=33.95 TRINITY_DN36366_c0_g1_i4:34-534(-)
MQMSIKVKLNDGSIREIDDNSSVFDLANSISRNLGKKAVVGEVNKTLVDLSYQLKENDEVNILTYDDEKAVEVMRHSITHIMAQAVKRLYKDVKLAIGPSIENGFYYDFDMETPLTTEDIKAVSYTHLTLPTILLVQISVVAVSFKKKNILISKYVASVLKINNIS